MDLKQKDPKVIAQNTEQYSPLNFRVVVVLVLFSAALFGGLYYSLSDSPSYSAGNPLPTLELTSLDSPDEPAAANSGPGRPVFAYSVIPGGVRNADELRAALRRDALAAAHYSGFRVERTKLVQLREDRAAYVSYRVGNQIFWSSRKVTLLAGEELLSDGRNLARTRCGNRLSMDPALPVAAAGEPSEATLGTPVVLPRPEVSTEAFPLPPIWGNGPNLPPIESLMSPPPGGSPGGPPTPAGPPIICCSSGPGPHGPVPLPPPPISTPEPSTLALLLAAIVLCALILKRRS